MNIDQGVMLSPMVHNKGKFVFLELVVLHIQRPQVRESITPIRLFRVALK